MLCVRAKVWYTAMFNSNGQNRTVVKHDMMFCCLLCATTSMLDLLLAMTFSFVLFVTVHPSHGLPVLVLIVSLESRSWSVTSKSWSWSWSWISKSWIQVCICPLSSVYHYLYAKYLLTLFLITLTAAHSDCCFISPCTNILTYFLSYLLIVNRLPYPQQVCKV